LNYTRARPLGTGPHTIPRLDAAPRRRHLTMIIVASVTQTRGAWRLLRR